VESNIAIMQPYIFPYIGYMNLVQSTDFFVFYDDVNFRKKGWINRNQFILNRGRYTFTLPIEQISQNKCIKESLVFDLSSFKKKFIHQLNLSYKKAPFLHPTLEYVERVLDHESRSFGLIASKSIIHFFEYLGIKKEFIFSSESFSSNKKLGRTERIIDITKKCNCKNYINVIGGRDLYSTAEFSDSGINLKFIIPIICNYRQVNANPFIDKLSIIDLMMNLPPNEIKLHLDSYSFET
jgi:hypothetical protein